MPTSLVPGSAHVVDSKLRYSSFFLTGLDVKNDKKRALGFGMFQVKRDEPLKCCRVLG